MTAKDNDIALCVMAGGIGERFWPLSRKSKPKQLLKITGNETMLRKTVSRHAGLVPLENVRIVTTKDQAPLVRQEMPEIRESSVIGEPCGRNTAPCIALAAALLYAKNPATVMVVVSSDHHIPDGELYRSVMGDAVTLARQERMLVTIGVKPRYPETGYGYVKPDKKIEYPGATPCYTVKTFVEKPPLEKAQALFEEGEACWNAGMFVFMAEDILKAMDTFLPECRKELMNIVAKAGTDGEQAAIEAYYAVAPKISIDYAVMEKAPNVALCCADFEWNDLGSWTSAAGYWLQDAFGNRRQGESEVLDCQGSIVGNYCPGTVAVLGMEDVVVIRTEDSVLVMPKSRVQDVKKLIASLDEKYR